MLVRFLKNKEFSVDGIVVLSCVVGQEIDLPEVVAKRQIIKGCAEVVAPKKELPAIENSALTESPVQERKPAARKRGRKPKQ